MSIGTNIKKRRYELKLSQQELADAMGYKTRSTIAKIESGKIDVSQKRLIKFAEVLDTTAEALISDSFNSSSKRDTRNITGHTATNLSTRSENPSRQKTVAIIMAGGKSSKNRQNIPNQFINVHNKPIIVYCLEAYESHPSVDDIYIVCLKGWEQIVAAYAEQYQITKLRGIIPAASSGIRSVQNGITLVNGLYNDNDIVIFQASTRPMVSVDMISKLLQACYESDSANICHSMNDYVQFQYKDGKAEYIDRKSVVELQSPEAYRLSFIKNVFSETKKIQHPLTESCIAMLLYNLGYKINFIEGGVNNLKIIRQEDIAVFESTI